MKDFMMPYGLMIILILAPLVVLYFLCKAKKTCPSDSRRRWGRIKVPNEKRMTCRITDPASLASNTDYIIDDINMSGIAFFSTEPVAKKTVRLLIRFPFADYGESANVLGRIAYCRQLSKTKFRVGVEYQRER